MDSLSDGSETAGVPKQGGQATTNKERAAQKWGLKSERRQAPPCPRIIKRTEAITKEKTASELAFGKRRWQESFSEH